MHDIYIYSYIDLDSPVTVTSLEASIEGYLSRFKNKEKGSVINVMQRLGVNDPTSFLFTGTSQTKPKLKNFKNICLPAKLNDKTEPIEIRDKYIDGYLDPIRLNQNILDNEKIKYGNKYEAQYDQKPFMNKDGLMYKDLKYFEGALPKGATYSFTDPADKGDDYLCTFFARVTNSKIIVYDAIYTKADHTETIPRLTQKLNNENCVVNWVESNSIGAVFVSQLQNKVPNIQGRFESTNKVSRILHYSHLVEFIEFKETGTTEYMLALEHIRYTPRNILNGGKGMDIDSADALTALLRYFYANFPHYFLDK